MVKKQKRAAKALVGAITDVRFDELCRFLTQLGFEERVLSSPHIFTKKGVAEILNLQPAANGKTKPYPVKQVREIVHKYEAR